MLGGGVGESAAGGGGFKKARTDYNAAINDPPLFDGGGKAGTFYIVSVGGTREFGPSNTLELKAGDFLFYSEGKWYKIDQSPEDFTFNGSRTVTRSGLPAVNVGGSTLLAWMEAYFFPSVAPGLSITGGTTIQYGAATARTINWTATKNTNPITAINIDGTVVAPTGNTQSGNKSVTVPNNPSTGFSGSVTAGSQTTNASTTFTRSHKRYWGKTAKNGTTQPILDSDILALTGAGSGAGNEFSSTRVQTRNGINGAGEFLVFAWPSSFGTPAFVINGLPNTAWTKVRANSAFINSDGYSEPYDVWISNTILTGSTNLQIN